MFSVDLDVLDPRQGYSEAFDTIVPCPAAMLHALVAYGPAPDHGGTYIFRDL